MTPQQVSAGFIKLRRWKLEGHWSDRSPLDTQKVFLIRTMTKPFSVCFLLFFPGSSILCWPICYPLGYPYSLLRHSVFSRVLYGRSHWKEALFLVPRIWNLLAPTNKQVKYWPTPISHPAMLHLAFLVKSTSLLSNSETPTPTFLDENIIVWWWCLHVSYWKQHFYQRSRHFSWWKDHFPQ